MNYLASSRFAESDLHTRLTCLIVLTFYPFPIGAKSIRSSERSATPFRAVGGACESEAYTQFGSPKN